MISYWSALYIIPLSVALGISLGQRKKDYIVITSISVIAYVITRIISEKVLGDRYIFDVANDLMVIATIVWFVGLRPIVLWLIATYAAMIYFSYIPYSEGVIDKQGNFITLEIIGKIQLFILFLGMYHGNLSSVLGKFSATKRIIQSYVNIRAKLYPMDNTGRADNYNSEGSNTKESNIPFRSGTHSDMAKDG